MPLFPAAAGDLFTRLYWRTRGLFSVKLGRCERCTRAALITAVIAWLVALLSAVALGASLLTVAVAVAALALTALWIAHKAHAGSRRTLESLLRDAGVARRDAVAIVAAIPDRLGDHRHLQDGDNVGLEFAPDAKGAPPRPVRVAIRGSDGASLVIVACGDDAYAVEREGEAAAPAALSR